MKFHDELNQKLFNGEELKPEVKDKLDEIASAFIEYLEVPSDAVKDAVLTGSSVSYNYTPHSDIDLHLKVDFDKVHEDCPIVQGYLWALKASFNKDHDISIYGVPVEVYAEPLDEDTVHNGLYSLWQDKWIDFPEKIAPTDNDDAVLAKYNEIKEAADRIEDSEVADELLSKIYEMRKAGLTEVGEFSTENLAFKKLRDAGVLDKLKKMKKEKIDKELSLESYSERLFQKELTPLPKKKPAYKIGDKVRVGDKEGTIIVVKSMGLSDTPVYKIKLDDGLVWRYEEELGVEMKEKFVQPYELYLYKRTEDGNDYTLVKDLHFDTEEEMRKHLATVKDQYDSFEMGKRTDDGSSLGRFNHIDEDVATLTDKVDTAQAELDSIIQSLKPSIKEELESLINEALGE